jgi:hypothetical protein
MPRNQLPPPLPPEERTVGQVVAEAIRLYGDRFWPSLALGFGPALLDLAVRPLPGPLQIAVAAGGGAVLMTASFVGACVIASRTRPSRRAVANAFAAGFLVWPPAALLPLVFALPGNTWIALLGLALPSLAWLAYVGLCVPAAVIERLDFRLAIGRAIELSRADFIHVLGSLATLVIAYVLSRGVMFFLLRGTAKTELGVAAFIADVVISPTIFLGAAIVYFDQVARADKLRPRAPGPAGSGEPEPLPAGPDDAGRRDVFRARAGDTKPSGIAPSAPPQEPEGDKVTPHIERSPDADLHPADDSDGTGSADAEVEPRAAARSEP